MSTFQTINKLCTGRTRISELCRLSGLRPGHALMAIRGISWTISSIETLKGDGNLWDRLAATVAAYNGGYILIRVYDDGDKPE